MDLVDGEGSSERLFELPGEWEFRMGVWEEEVHHYSYGLLLTFIRWVMSKNISVYSPFWTSP